MGKGGRVESSERARETPARSQAPLKRPCRCPCRVLGEAFASALEEPYSHQLGVCGRLGIAWSTHMRWMAADAEPDSDLAEYQSAVLSALDRQRRLDLENGQSQLDQAHPAKAGAQFNMFRFQHENRFKRFYGDQESAKRVELSGPDGGPIETANVRYVVAIPEEEPDQEP